MAIVENIWLCANRIISVRFGFFVSWDINFRGLFDAEAILVEEEQEYYLTHGWEG